MLWPREARCLVSRLLCYIAVINDRCYAPRSNQSEEQGSDKVTFSSFKQVTNKLVGIAVEEESQTYKGVRHG